MNERPLNALIIGGTSGLGLEIGRALNNQGEVVFATGRRERELPKGIHFAEFEITHNVDRLKRDLETLLQTLPDIDLLVYAAGFHEDGHIEKLSDLHIERMVNVGLTLPALLIKRLIKKQSGLSSLIMITSTSQWIPREKEPLYTAIKAGSAMLANSVSLDPKVGKVLVVGPAGMNTHFWVGTERKDLQTLLSPEWVAAETLKLWEGDYTYCLARLLREPARVEVLETRLN